MIVRVKDVHAALRIAGDSPRLIELAVAPTVFAKGADELAVGRELLHAMVAVLAQIDIPAGLASQCRVVEQNIVRIIELTRPIALLAPRFHQLRLAAAGVEHLHAMVAGVSRRIA